MARHNCAQCAYLKRTSPTQVFLLCTYWASPSHSHADYGWLITHCHVQPEAPACFAFKVNREALRKALKALKEVA